MDKPVSLLIDELTFLVGTAEQNDELLTEDMNELVNRIARSHGVWLTLATQELFRLSGQIRQTVLSMGTVIFGQTSDRQAAKELAERYYPYEPYKVKKSRPVFGMDYTNRVRGEQMVVGEQTTEFTQAEQIDENSRIFLKLAPFHFLIGQSSREGELPTMLRRFSIEQVDAGEYPNKKTIDSLRSQLMQRDGSREDTIRADIATRLQNLPQPAVPGVSWTGRPGPARGSAAPAASETAPAGSGSQTQSEEVRRPDWETASAPTPARTGEPATDTPAAGTHPQQPTATPPAGASPPAVLKPPVHQAAAEPPTDLPPVQNGLPPLQPPRRRRRPGIQNPPDAASSPR